MSPADPAIRMLRGLDELDACVALQKLVWGQDCTEIVPVSVLLTIPRLGGIVAGAFAATGELVGMVVGFGGFVDGKPIHWSDMLGVKPGLRDRGLGERLKWFQREALLGAGVEHVYWTFDPLESRNAHLNLERLGAEAWEYHRDYYGDSASPLHEGLGTDRLVVDWAIGSERVRRRRRGSGSGPARAVWSAWPAVLEAEASGRLPRPGAHREADAPRLRLAIPADIQALKRADPALAREWRDATRRAFEASLERGYGVVGLVRDGAVSYYVLARGESSES